MEESTVPAPDTTPPGEETQELSPEEQLDEEEGEKYDGGEIPPASEPESDE